MSWFVHARLSELKRLVTRAIREREEHAEEASCGEMSGGEISGGEISDIRTDVSADDTTERPAEPRKTSEGLCKRLRIFVEVFCRSGNSVWLHHRQ